MATAAQVIKASLLKILVQGSEAELQPDEFQDAIFDLNNLMLAYDADGITLGYTEVSNLGDQVTVPLGALRGIIYNLAIEIAPEYNGTVTPGIERIALAGLSAMRKLGVAIPVSRLPCTLPIGSGNEGYGHRYNPFFHCDEDAILAETTGSISLESGTNQAASS